MPTRHRSSDELSAVREHVAACAIIKGGVFRREDLQPWGVDPGVVRTLVARRHWVRLRHGVYSDAATLQSAIRNPHEKHRLDCAAAIAALPLPAFAFGPTAAVVHGLPLERGVLGDVQLVRPRGTDVRALSRRVTPKPTLPGTRVRTHDLAHSDVLTISGIPTVSRDLSALSTAAASSSDWAIVVLDAVAWGRPDAVEALSRLAADWPYLRGIGTVRAALPHVRSGAQTPLESLSRVRFVAAGLPEPELQFPLFDRRGLIGYADVAWPGLGVIGEADGLLKYTSREDLISEKLREDRIRALGWIVIRWTWLELMRDPQAIVNRIRQGASLPHRRAG